MKTKCYYILVLMACCLAILSCKQETTQKSNEELSLEHGIEPANGWFVAGDSPHKYIMGIDKGKGKSGNAATIKSIVHPIEGFGTLMQNCKPDKFLGKRVRMSGYLKSEDVADWTGFWFRVDQEGSSESLAFDNMQDRGIKGNTEWKKYEVVLDVPVIASNLAYGVLISGTGQVWFDEITFEIVDSTVQPTDAKLSRNILPAEPENLNFESIKK